MFEYVSQQKTRSNSLNHGESLSIMGSKPIHDKIPIQVNQDTYNNQNITNDNERVHKIRIVEKLGKAITSHIHDDSLNVSDTQGEYQNGSNKASNSLPGTGLSPTGSFRLRNDDMVSSNDPTLISWLSDAELSRLSPSQLEEVMERYVTAVISQLVHYAAIDDDFKTELDSLDQSGFTLLHYCCLYNLQSLLPVLISKEVQVNIKSANGQTALHLAVERGNLEIADMLLAAGADNSIVDDQGRSVREVGLSTGKPTILAYCNEKVRHFELCDSFMNLFHRLSCCH